MWFDKKVLAQLIRFNFFLFLIVTYLLKANDMGSQF